MRPIYTTDLRLTNTEYTADIQPKTGSKIIFTDIIADFWMMTKIPSSSPLKNNKSKTYFPYAETPNIVRMISIQSMII